METKKAIIISILNFKGGVGKTITAANFGDMLSKLGFKILFIDADKQGNLSQYFSKFKEDKKGLDRILTTKCVDIKEFICKTENKNIDIITSNMNLYESERKIYNMESDKFNILKIALDSVKNEYDYCIIDNAPTIDLITINSLIASNQVIIPIRADNFSYKAINELLEQVENAKQINSELEFKGCLLTHYQNNEVNNQFKGLIKTKCNVFETNIRFNKNIQESTFYKKTLREYNSRCGASQDYKKFTKEYVKTCTNRTH
ncbi:hypothetical protein BGU59_09935 [Clostridioides difficile]|nr:hypothetical protein BGU59_09935 [Clostridioides difficile]